MANLLTTTIGAGITEKEGTSTLNVVTNGVSTIPQVGANAVYTANNTTVATTVYNVASGKVVVAYGDTSDSGYGKAVVGTVSGTGASATITFGTPVPFSGTTSVGGGGEPGIALADLPGSSKVVIAWAEGASGSGGLGTSIVGTISGTTISFGAEATFDTSGYGLRGGQYHISKAIVSDTTNNRVILAWHGFGTTVNTTTRQGWASVGTVSGTTLTWTTPQIFETEAGAAANGQVYSLAATWDATNQAIVLTWEDADGNPSVVGTGSVVGTIDGSNIITFGTVVREAINYDYNALTYHAAKGKIVHMGRLYKDNNVVVRDWNGTARVGTVSGTGSSITITWGAPSSFPLINTVSTVSTYSTGPFDNRAIYHADAQKVLLVYSISPSGVTGAIKGVVGTITGTTISLSSEVDLNTDNGNPGVEQTVTGLTYDTVAKCIVLANNSSGSGVGRKGTLIHFDGHVPVADLATGNFFEIDLESATNDITTFTITGVKSGYVNSFLLKITQGSTARQIDWGTMSGVEPLWPGGTAPVLSAAYDAVDVYSFITYDNGTTWYGSVVGNYPKPIPANLPLGERGVFGGGTSLNNIDYITISTFGNATDFGDLTLARDGIAATSDGSRGIFAGGGPYTDTIDYITIATTGNATDFGNMTASFSRRAALSGGGRAVIGGGVQSNGQTYNGIEYITIATTGNATSFGNLVGNTRGDPAGVSDGTRGIFAGGAHGGTVLNSIEYITIATPSNGILFGVSTNVLIVARSMLAGTSDGERAIFAGGWITTNTYSNTIDYITIATLATAIDFGNLTLSRGGISAVSNGSRAVFGGGTYSNAHRNIMDYITIAIPVTTASDFGDLTAIKAQTGATSGD